MRTKENKHTSESFDDESIKDLEKGKEKQPIGALQLDVGEEHIRFRKRWWQLWYIPALESFTTIDLRCPRIPAGLPPPPPDSLDNAKVIELRMCALVN